jgi:chromosome segregation ATPase
MPVPNPYKSLPKKRERNTIIAIIFLGVLVFVLWRYFIVIREKKIIQSKLTVTESNLVTLEGERKLLTQELTRELKLKEELLSAKVILERNLADKEEKLIQVEAALEKVEAEKGELDTKVRALTEEKMRLEEKLSSVENLKKAIKELKIKMRQDKQNKNLNNAAVEGNLGYIVKDGTPTYPPKKRVNVIPLP